MSWIATAAVAGAVLGPSLMGGGGGGGGGGSGSPTQTTTNYNAVSGYAAPYVENMLGSTQGLLYNVDAEGKPTGLKGYEAYPGQRTADFTGLQNKAFGSADNLGVMGQTQQASNLAGQAGLGALSMQYNPMMARTQNFDDRSAAQYMNPFVQQALAPQMAQIARQGEQQKLGNAGQATQAGAFGGSRFGIQNAMTDYNTQLAQAGAYGTGMQNAYQNAQQQFNADQARSLQTQQLNQGQQQFGANLGLQGLQTGLTAANTLGTLGQNQYAQETGNINLQNQLGTQQQQQQQNILNQQYQDFLNQKQDPYNKLAFQQSMLSGLPIASNVQNVYSNPSMLSQVAGLGTAAAGAYGMYNSMGKPAAKGGSTKDIKKRPAGLAELALHKMA